MKSTSLFLFLVLMADISFGQTFQFAELLSSRSNQYQPDSANSYLMINGNWQLDSTSTISYYPTGIIREIRGYRLSENRYSNIQFYPDGYPMLLMTYVPNGATLERYTAIRRGANYIVIERGRNMLNPLSFPMIDSLVWTGSFTQPSLVSRYSRSLQPNAQPILEEEFSNIIYNGLGHLKAYREVKLQQIREISSLYWPGIYPGTLEALTHIHFKLMAREGLTGFLGNFRWPFIVGYGKTISPNGIVQYQFDYNSQLDTFGLTRRSGASNHTLFDDGFRVKHHFNQVLQREFIVSYHQYSPTQIQAYQTQRYEVDPNREFIVFEHTSTGGYFRYDSLALQYTGQALKEIQYYQNTNSTTMTPVWKIEFLQAGFALGSSMQEKQQSPSFHVYPNPAQSELTVAWQASDRPVSVEIYNLQGKKVLGEKIAQGQSKIELALEGFAPGLYIVRLQNGHQNQSIRFIKAE